MLILLARVLQNPIWRHFLKALSARRFDGKIFKTKTICRMKLRKLVELRYEFRKLNF